MINWSSMIKNRLLLSLFLALSLQNFLLSSCSKQDQAKANQENTSPKVANNKGIPTYVFYYAEWCPHCHKMAPNVKKASEEFAGKVFFYYVNMEDEDGKKFTSKYRPKGRGIPFAQHYDGEGNLVKESLGYVSYEDLKSQLSKLR